MKFFTTAFNAIRCWFACRRSATKSSCPQGSPRACAPRRKASAAIPLTFYTIYYIDGGLGGGHLTPKLVGFLDPLDREFFETFTTVPGVGFMRALKCLIRPLNEIAMAIEGGDAAFLKELPFIGAKTSERIITELRGKMAKFALARTEEPLSVEQESTSALKQEALQVLEQLEYSRAEALRMVEEIFARNKNLKTTEEFLRKVFEQLHPGTTG